MADLTPNDLSHLSDAEFHALCPQGEHAPGPEPLSPAARAIVAAVTQAQYALDPEDVENEAARIRFELAHALRALADQVVPELGRSPEDSREDECLCVRADVLAIAAELEGRADA